MKEVIIIIFYFILLLAVHGNTYQCPDCIIPCVPNPDLNISASHLLQTFHHRIRDLTLLTFLDAINGDVRFMSSNGRDVFSKTISLTTDGYTMSELCSIFSNPPRVLRTNPHPKIKFRYFPTYLLSDIDESGNFYLFEKMSLLLIEQRDINVQLKDVKSDFDVLNYTVHDVGLSLQEVEVDNDALHRKLEMRKKLEYAILDALVYGTGILCKPSDYRFQLPMSAKNNQHCLVVYPNWMYFKLLQEFEFNVIQMYHWDGDSRVITYSIDISRDGISWTSLIVGYRGKQLVIHRFSQTYTALYLRMQGSNTLYPDLALDWVKLDLI